MRDAILCTLTATVGPIPAKKAINALLPVIALYGNLLTNSLEVCSLALSAFLIAFLGCNLIMIGFVGIHAAQPKGS